MVTENRRWEAQIDFTNFLNDQILEARWLGDALNGRVNVLRLAVDNSRTPRFQGDVAAFYKSIGVPDAFVALGYIPHSDDTSFSDGTGYALPDYDAPRVTEPGVQGGTSIRVTGFLGRNLKPGAYFSDALDHLYRVERNDDGRLVVNPPFRRTILGNERIEVSAPKFRCRLAQDAGWKPMVERGLYGQAFTAQVVEAFDR